MEVWLIIWDNMAKKKKKRSFLSKLFSRFLVCIIFILGCLIILKSSPSLKKDVYQYVFNSNISFGKFQQIYEKYIGKFPFKESVQTVSSNFNYLKNEEYKDGAKLSVGKDYVTVSRKSGIVIFAGEKEGYGKTVIVQEADDLEVWYGGLKEIKVSMYDYLKSGEVIGSCDDDLYMAFMKDGKVLNYKKYI